MGRKVITRVYQLVGNYVEIDVNGDKVLMDSDMWEKLDKQIYIIKPSKTSGKYVQFKDGNYLHRWIMEQLGHDITGKLVDHINHNPLDNRKCNLRLVSYSENFQNKVGYGKNKFKGSRKRDGKYEVYISKDRKQMYVGRYDSEDVAAEAYNTAARALFGQFALLNNTPADICDIEKKRIEKKINTYFQGVN
jgi:hypothetical protein